MAKKHKQKPDHAEVRASTAAVRPEAGVWPAAEDEAQGV